MPKRSVVALLRQHPGVADFFSYLFPVQSFQNHDGVFAGSPQQIPNLRQRNLAFFLDTPADQLHRPVIMLPVEADLAVPGSRR